MSAPKEVTNEVRDVLDALALEFEAERKRPLGGFTVRELADRLGVTYNIAQRVIDGKIRAGKLTQGEALIDGHRVHIYSPTDAD